MTTTMHLIVYKAQQIQQSRSENELRRTVHYAVMHMPIGKGEVIGVKFLQKSNHNLFASTFCRLQY